MENKILTKPFKVIYKGKELVKELTKEPNNNKVYVSVDATAAEFDTYSEAKAYVDEHNLVYEETKYGE
jgi:hypothetical protein